MVDEVQAPLSYSTNAFSLDYLLFSRFVLADRLSFLVVARA